MIAQFATGDGLQKRLPVVTIVLAGAACLTAVDVGLSQRLAFDRLAIAQGDLLRLFTGHFVHWSADHLLWDALMFVALGAVIELRSRLALWKTIAWSAAAISAGLWFFQPDIATYRGLSGVDSALFTWIAATSWIEARRRGQSYLAFVALATLAAFLAKIGWEIATATTLFVDSSQGGFTPLPLVHLIGGAVGVAAAWQSARSTRQSAIDTNPAANTAYEQIVKTS